MILKLSGGEIIPLPGVDQAMNFFTQCHVITVMHRHAPVGARVSDWPRERPACGRIRRYIVAHGATQDNATSARRATLSTELSAKNCEVDDELDGTLVSNVVLDIGEVATDTIDYVATDSSGNTATCHHRTRSRHSDLHGATEPRN